MKDNFYDEPQEWEEPKETMNKPQVPVERVFKKTYPTGEPQLSAEIEHLKSSEYGLWKTDKHPFDFFMDVYSEARKRWKNTDDFNEYIPELLKQAIKNNFWQEGKDANAQ